MAIKSTERHTENRATASSQNHIRNQATSFHVADIRQLIALMNTSDLNEIVIARPEDGLKLVLRCSQDEPTPHNNHLPINIPQTISSLVSSNGTQADIIEGTISQIAITAPLVGRFHPAIKNNQKPLVNVGDIVREGQVVAGIETLHVMNEVEANASGRVAAIKVQAGEAVEYGQELIILDPIG
jgi:acetyl-CoA carboxylase biotin carboxyl carrier protein